MGCIPDRTRRLLTLGAGVLAALACGRVIAPAPPAGAPTVAQEAVVGGVPITIAARAARGLNEFGFTTRRFGSDSTWGWRAADETAARLRYTMPSRDSTRVLVELWGRCDPGDRACLRGDLFAILARLATEERPPQ